MAAGGTRTTIRCAFCVSPHRGQGLSWVLLFLPFAHAMPLPDLPQMPIESRRAVPSGVFVLTSTHQTFHLPCFFAPPRAASPIRDFALAAREARARKRARRRQEHGGGAHGKARQGRRAPQEAAQCILSGALFPRAGAGRIHWREYAHEQNAAITWTSPLHMHMQSQKHADHAATS